MEAENGVQPSWSNLQAYGLAVLALALGGAIGFVLHGPTTVKPVVMQQEVAQPQEQQPSADAQNPHAGGMPSMDRMKKMADKQAEPLLAKLKQNPNDAATLAEVGKVYLYTHQIETALDYYERSAKAKPDPKILNTLGGLYHFSGADNKAQDAWERALKLEPNYPDALYNLGLIKLGKSDAKGAVALWERLVKTNPNHPQRAKVEQMIAKAKTEGHL